MSDCLERISRDTLQFAYDTYVRPLYHTIDWENHLNALLGTRGVGKTTLLIQRLQELKLPPSKAMYIDLGDPYFQEIDSLTSDRTTQVEEDSIYSLTRYITTGTFSMIAMQL